MNHQSSNFLPHFTPFEPCELANIALPQRFTFPFHYQPHPLCLLAAGAIQDYLKQQKEWSHNFGFDDPTDALGKMFGVLVVENIAGKLGYLAAFSGKLGFKTYVSDRFVPPVFDILEKNGFYVNGEAEITAINRKIDELEATPQYIDLQTTFQTETQAAKQAIETKKQALKFAKSARNERRTYARTHASKTDFEILETKLNEESAELNFQLKDLQRAWKRRLESLENELNALKNEIQRLKMERKRRSAALQRQLFERYCFLNIRQEKKSLYEIFDISETELPPSGAGECAAPKLLQYAFLNNLRPVSMAEFWWGISPSSEVRQHGAFYPACKTKCEPILGHMLAGMELDENPLLKNPALGKTLDIVFEDEYLVIVNKPTEFLSVPGKNITDSVQTRLREMYPNADGPLTVHRLDMSTSGVMLAAKTKAVHENLQAQFANRKVKKRYVALLDGVLEGNEGTIDLPLRVDLDNRPQQLVCYEYGKTALTHWKVLEKTATQTRVHFFPVTGRTHQLRVHAAHVRGLGLPILGDDLYGRKGERLHLHAESIQFTHPISGETLEIEVKCPF